MHFRVIFYLLNFGNGSIGLEDFFLSNGNNASFEVFCFGFALLSHRFENFLVTAPQNDTAKVAGKAKTKARVFICSIK